MSERVFCALKFRDALDFSSVAQKYLVVTRVHMPRDGNGLSGVGRTRDLPQKVLQDWMASNLFTKKSAQSIFAAVEAYAAARGYSPREATDLRHQLTPRMITFAAGQVVGKRVETTLEKHVTLYTLRLAVDDAVLVSEMKRQHKVVVGSRTWSNCRV